MEYPYKYAALVLDGHSTCEAKSEIGLPLNASQPFSIDAWVRPVDVYAQKSILRQEGVIDFGVDRDMVYLSIDGYPTIISMPQQGVVEKDVWTHICAVYNGSGFFLYVNGVPNLYAAATGNGGAGKSPFVFGKGFAGSVKQARVFKKALDSDAVMQYMLQNDISDTAYRDALAACYDFTQVPAKETVSGNAISLKDGARQDGFSNGAIFSGNAFIEIDGEPQINPGGQGNDSYTVQSWVYLEPSDFETSHVIFSNGNMMEDSGMALYIDKIGADYKVKSVRASDSGDDVLISKASIPARQWVNIATTYSVDTLKIYIDGVPDSSLAGLFPLAYKLDTTIPRIGSEIVANNENGIFWFSGAISRIDLWKAALEESNIKKYAGEAPPPAESDLLAVYNFHMDDNVNSRTGTPASGYNGIVFREL
jgi:hypothetical protein